MKNLELIKPKIREYGYYKKILNNPKTMSYNAGYDIHNNGYHYDTGCIEFNYDKWNNNINNHYLAYIRDTSLKKYIGYVNYNYNGDDNIYECGIVIDDKYRGKGYAKDSLKLLIKEAYNNGVEYLYDTFEKDRGNTLQLFLSIGFEVLEEIKITKFNKQVDGVIVRIKTDKVLPNFDSIKNIDDVLKFMKDFIRYGWIDINNNIHIGNMKEFRSIYKTMTIDKILQLGIGTCIDQVNLMHYLLDKINIKNKMFATRIYERDDYNDLDSEEHMHCFILCYIENHVYHIEHPNWYRVGIYKYDNEIDALETINKYYVELSGGISRPITEFYEVKPNLSFKEFNNYINSLDEIQFFN